MRSVRGVMSGFTARCACSRVDGFCLFRASMLRKVSMNAAQYRQFSEGLLHAQRDVDQGGTGIVLRIYSVFFGNRNTSWLTPPGKDAAPTALLVVFRRCAET